mmetsp:Transcript_15927/g.33454  ORF Transcript_15927/g.33454 Transcript_15927/m.33454 type:complete len:225 (+) Transcript_15927:678-1352(+)
MTSPEFLIYDCRTFHVRLVIVSGNQITIFPVLSLSGVHFLSLFRNVRNPSRLSALPSLQSPDLIFRSFGSGSWIDQYRLWDSRIGYHRVHCCFLHPRIVISRSCTSRPSDTIGIGQCGLTRNSPQFGHGHIHDFEDVTSPLGIVYGETIYHCSWKCRFGVRCKGCLSALCGWNLCFSYLRSVRCRCRCRFSSGREAFQNDLTDVGSFVAGTRTTCRIVCCSRSR